MTKKMINGNELVTKLTKKDIDSITGEKTVWINNLEVSCDTDVTAVAITVTSHGGVYRYTFFADSTFTAKQMHAYNTNEPCKYREY